MNAWRLVSCCGAAILLLAPSVSAQPTAVEVDLRRIVPQEAHLAIHARHNPERDYQRPLFAEVWNQFKAERLDERFLEIFTSRMSTGDLADAEAVIDEFYAALEPVLEVSVWDAQESVVAQRMVLMTNQSLVAMRLPPGNAAKIETAFKNLVAMAEQHSDGKIPTGSETVEGIEITFLSLPPQVPLQPACARIEDVVLFSTSKTWLASAIRALDDETVVSKFDDPRLAEALEHLPAPEDMLTFFDGKLLFDNLRAMGGQIAQQPGLKDNTEALAQFNRIFNLVIDEVAIIDYEVAVVTTEGNENRTTALGRYPAGAEATLMGKLALGGKPFTDWQSWIPADAEGYTLNTGVQLHAAYERLLEILNSQFPETKLALEKFEQAQQQIDLHLDRDLFQSFSGESVAVTLPAAGGGQETVSAIRCTNPERIRDLLHRLVSTLGKLPALESQKLAWNATSDLEGFETLNVALLAAFEVKPVVGFRDGWMMVGSSPTAIERVLAARNGTAQTILGSEHFARFHLPVPESVNSLSYTDLRAGIHNAADMLRKFGGVAPLFLGMAAANSNSEQLQPVTELLALLPSVAKVIEKFDFYDARLTAVSAGPLPRSYVKQGVTLIRQAETPASTNPSNQPVPERE